MIIILNADKLSWALNSIINEAFSPQSVSGGVLGVMVFGFKRAVFSNEAGIGSAAIVHSAVKTEEPVTEGYVGLLEPFIAILFAYSTMISWSYYGLKGWTYVFGESKPAEIIFKLIFCAFVALGCMIQLESVLDFSDALVFLVSIPNIIGLYILAPVIKEELRKYQAKIRLIDKY